MPIVNNGNNFNESVKKLSAFKNFLLQKNCNVKADGSLIEYINKTVKKVSEDGKLYHKFKFTICFKI